MRVAGSSRAATVLLGAAAAAVLVSACGSSKSNSTASTSASTQALTVTETALGPKSFAYQGLKPVSGGPVKITFTNGDKQNSHEFQLARIDPGHTGAELKAALVKLTSSQTGVPIPSWLHPASGVGPTGPGQSATAIVNLPQGQYFAVDTQSPHGPGNNPPFLTEGAFTPLQVSNAATGSLPSTAGSVAVKDKPGDKFRFVVSGLKAGPNTITFNNKSKEDHHVLAVRLLPGHTPAQAKAALLSNGPPKGQPPVDFTSFNGTAVAESKTTQVNQLTLAQPGNYILLCFLTDKDGKGKPHLARGLFTEVKVS